MPSLPALRIRRQATFLAFALTLGLAACGGTPDADKATKDGFSQAKQDSSATITVWVDQTRAAAADAFTKANPDVKIKVVSYDGSANGSNTFKTKMRLYDRAGKGWPDVVFSSQNNDAAWASQKSGNQQAFAAVLNKGLIAEPVLDGFTDGALDPCTVDGNVYCLRNDLAPNVLWYNKTLLQSFGYQLPKTWEEYQELGDRVAKEHPGYIVGAVGDSFAPEIYLWASKCQANRVTGARSVSVDTGTAECKRAAALIDTLVAAKSLTTLSVFAPEFVQKYTGKVLLMPGPAWYAGALFNNKESLNLAPGQLAVAKPLGWGSEPAVTGNVGGGTWFVSSHSTNLAAATKFVDFATGSAEYQVELSPGYPATSKAGSGWISKQESSGFYASDLSADHRRGDDGLGWLGFARSSARRRSGPRRSPRRWPRAAAWKTSCRPGRPRSRTRPRSAATRSAAGRPTERVDGNLARDRGAGPALTGSAAAPALPDRLLPRLAATSCSPSSSASPPLSTPCTSRSPTPTARSLRPRTSPRCSTTSASSRRSPTSRCSW